MKKILSWLSAMTVLFSMISTVSYAEYQNKLIVDSNIEDSTATLKFSLETSSASSDMFEFCVDLSEAYSAGITASDITVSKDSSISTGQINTKTNTIQFNYVNTVDGYLEPTNGIYTFGTVTIDLTNAKQAFKLPLKSFEYWDYDEYENWADKFDMTVLNTLSIKKATPSAEITGITIDPATATVEGGSTYDLSKIVTTATYSDDSTAEVTPTWSGKGVEGTTFTAPAATAEDQTITLTATFEEKTADLTVTVPAKEPEKDFTFEAADDIYVGETKDAVKVFNCNINKADFSKMVVFTFTAGEETKSFNGVFSGFDGETGLKNFSVLMFNAPADLTLDSITQ